MTLFQALVLGVVQGLTEFLPISSSAHLVFVPYLLGWQIPTEEAFVFFILVQWGTLLAVILYFWDDLLSIARGMLKSLNARNKTTSEARLGWLLILATLPAVGAGWLIKDRVEAAFSSLAATGFFLLITAALLVFAERVGNRSRPIEDVNTRNALLIGVFQIFSLFPGISRSGATISGGMALNLRRRAAARFAFLMAVPVMFGAGVLALQDLGQLPEGKQLLAPLALGFLVSAGVGYLSIRWLLTYLSQRSLYPFAMYCLVAGLIALFAS